MAEKKTYKYEILGKVIETETELTTEDIDEIAAQISPIPIDTADLSGAEDFGYIQPTQEELISNRAYALGMQEGGRRLAEGLGQTRMAIREGVGMETPEAKQAYTDEINRRRAEALQQPIAKEGWFKVGEAVGETAPTLLVPGAAYARAATFPGKLLAAGTAGGLAEAVKPTQDADFFNRERALNTGLGVAMGAGGEAIMQGVPLVYQAGKRFYQGAPGTLKRLMGQEDIVPDIKEAAEEFRTFVSPSEASGRTEVAGFEATLQNVSEEANRAINNAVRDREMSLNSSIKEVIEGIQASPHIQRLEELAPTIANTVVKPQAVPKLFANTPYSEYGLKLFREFEKNPAFQRSIKEGKIEKNSIEYFDRFKRFLDRKQDAAFRGAKENPELGEVGDQIRNFKAGFLDNLEVASQGTYKEFRDLTQLGIVQADLAKATTKVPTAQIQVDGKTMEIFDPVAFYRSTLKDPEKFAKIRSNLSNNPDALKKVAKLKTLLAAIEGSPLQGSFGRVQDALPDSGRGGIYGKGVATAFTLIDFMNKKRADELVMLISDNKWPSALLDSVDPSALKKGSIEAYNAFTQALDRVGASMATQDNPQVDMTVEYPNEPAQ